MASNLIANYLVNHKEKKRVKGVTHMTMHREFSTSTLVDIKFNLPKFSVIKEIKLNFTILNNKSELPYNMITGIEALDKLYIVLNFEYNFIK